MQSSGNTAHKNDRHRKDHAHPPRPLNRRAGETASSPEPPALLVLLRNMKFGQRGTVSKIDAPGELGRRIRDMGIVPGTPIEVQGRAPLKDPVAVKVRDCTLALRNNEADRIWVGVEEGALHE